MPPLVDLLHVDRLGHLDGRILGLALLSYLTHKYAHPGFVMPLIGPIVRSVTSGDAWNSKVISIRLVASLPPLAPRNSTWPSGKPRKLAALVRPVSDAKVSRYSPATSPAER